MHPEQTALEHQQRLLALLTEAIELEGEARAALLAGVDRELAEEVRALLDNEPGDGFLERVPFKLAAPGGEGAAAPVAGREIGPYRILELLGAGGMGEVYLAEQEHPVRRRVALKLLRFSLHHPELRQRFDAERRAMERLDHPNVGKILDAGSTDDGTPYLVMEHIVGEPITDYCDRRRLSIEERIRLVVAVCRGLEHAHQRFLLHRDIKPMNVLVAEVDGRPVPKLIDFGIAKVLDASELGALTGHFLVGTPSYMSPEALAQQRDLDTRTDVYSLGLLLYELLAGTLPFDEEDPTLTRHLRRLTEEDLKLPSARFTALDAEQAQRIAERRGLSADGLRRRLRGDPDAIVGKATARVREQRYGSPADLAADLERHLSNRPVVAQTTGTWYRVGKLVRRHRAGAVAVAAVAAALVLGFVATSLALVRARQAEATARAQEEKARREAETSKRVVEFVLDMFRVADPRYGDGGAVTAREILDQGAAKILHDLDSEPQIQATLKGTIGKVYASVGLYEQAAPLLEDALASRRRLLAEDDPGVAESLHELGKLHVHQAEFDAAEPLARQALAMRRERSGEDSVEVADVLVTLGRLLYLTSRFEESATCLEEALAIYRGRLGREHRKVGETLELYGSLLLYRGQPEDAERVLREALAMMTRLLGEPHPRVAEVRSSLGWALSKAGDPAAAEEVLSQSLALLESQQIDYPSLRFKHLVLLADTLIDQEKISEGERVAARALDLARRTFPAGHWATASAEATLASCRWRRGDFAAAEPVLLASHRAIAAQTGENTPMARHSLRELARLYEAWGREDEAIRYRRQLDATR